MYKQFGLSNIQLLIVAAFIGVIAIILGISFQQQLNQQQDTQHSMPDLQLSAISLLPYPKDIQDIELTNHLNESMSVNDLKGKWSLLFFGFTHCPDVCPSTMQTLKTIKKNVSSQLSDTTAWGNYQVVYVSVDPERDTPEQLASYIPYFDNNFIGLTSSLETLKKLTKQFGVPYKKQDADEQGNYEVDHYAGILLLNPKAQLSALISAPLNIDNVSQDLVTLAKHYKKDHQQIITIINNKTETNSTKNETKEGLSSDKVKGLVLENAWIRPAPPRAPSRAGYGVLRNMTNQDIIIEDASSDQFSMVMMHDTIIENNVASMVHNDTVTVPANGSVTFKPEGKHFMLMRSKQPLDMNDQVTVHLTDSEGTVFSVNMAVREAPKVNGAE